MMSKHVLAIILALMLTSLALGAGSPSSSRPPAPADTHLKYYNEGAKAEQRGDYQQAVELYRKALKEKPDFADAHNNLGFSLRQISSGYTKQAGAEYAEALRLAPDHEGALEYQAELYIQQGELRKAYDNYQRLLRLNSPEASKLKAKLDKVLAEAKSL